MADDFTTERLRRDESPAERLRRDEFPTERLRRDEFAWMDTGESVYLNAASTGPLPDLPATFCFRDFRHLASGAEALLGEDGREGEAIAAVMLGIALLDGARALGLDVSREGRELESLLRRLEERGARV